MAEVGGFGMEKAALRVQLNKAKSEPVNCAVGKGKDARAAYILLDHIKPAKALQTMLEKDFPDMKDARRGSVSIDAEQDAKLALIRLNKPASGLAPRLIKLLKPAGISKIRFEYEDGSEPEALEEAEEEGAPPPTAEAAPPPPPPPPDAAAVKHHLTELVQSLGAAIAADPSKKDALMGLAREAQTLLAKGDAAGADAKAGELAQLLTTAPKPAPAPGPAGAVAYAKSRLAWLAVRKKMQTDFASLRTQLIDDMKDEEGGDAVGPAFDERVEPVLQNLDEALADALDDASNETDPTLRAGKVEQARTIITRYQTYVANETLLAELDDNPFVPMKVQATLNATLSTLAGALR